MRKLSHLIAVSLLVAPAISHACANKESVIFSCTTKKMKFVEVCDAKQTIKYSYGKKGVTPELALSVPREKVTTIQWNGMGSSMYYDVNIPNGKTVYSAYWNAEKGPEGEVSAGIIAEVDGKQVADIACDMSSVEQNIEGVDLKQIE